MGPSEGNAGADAQVKRCGAAARRCGNVALWQQQQMDNAWCNSQADGTAQMRQCGTTAAAAGGRCAASSADGWTDTATRGHRASTQKAPGLGNGMGFSALYYYSTNADK
jgi:hypothetical protein